MELSRQPKVRPTRIRYRMKNIILRMLNHLQHILHSRSFLQLPQWHLKRNETINETYLNKKAKRAESRSRFQSLEVDYNCYNNSQCRSDLLVIEMCNIYLTLLDIENIEIHRNIVVK